MTTPADELPLMPMHMLRPGQRARIEGLFGTGDTIHRLRELGLRDGVLVEMIRPGSPCLLRLAGQTLAFRADELTSVLVRIDAEAQPRW
jgi:ferrous iron transport protein A